MLSSACLAVHGYLVGFAGESGEGVIGDQHLVVTAQWLAAMVADPVNPVLPVIDVALGTLPGHNRSSRLLARHGILTPQCLQRQLMKPLPPFTDAGIHIVVRVGALDHDPDLRGAALRTDVTGMNFLTCEDDVEIDRINALVPPARDIPVTLYQIGPLPAARRILDHVLDVIAFLAHRIRQRDHRLVPRDNVELVRVAITVAVFRRTIRNNPEGLIADAGQAQPEGRVHACLDAGFPGIPTALTERVEQPYPGHPGKRALHGGLQPPRYFVLRFDLLLEPDRQREARGPMCPVIFFRLSRGQGLQLERLVSVRREPGHRSRLDPEILEDSPAVNVSPAHWELEPQQFDHVQNERVILIGAELDPLNVQLKSVAI